ncbi:ribonuclease VapC [Methanocaldococcus indicus]|uniref:ribonuclease VapC n=1 Tax=Methanocaldococcus indicus TaxID=213231 RepID=UPI003C6D53D0
MFISSHREEKKNKKYVLDASAIIHGYNPNYYDYEYYITPETLEEIEENKVIINQAIQLGKVKIIQPKEEYIKKVKEVMKETGDNLSYQDILCVALSLQLNATILTDDFGIQNVAKKLNLDCEGIFYKTNKSFVWKKVCKGCKKIYPIDYEGECEICGSKIVRKAIKVKRE